MEKTITLQQILKMSNSFGWVFKLPKNMQGLAEEMHDIWLGVLQESIKGRHDEIRKVRAEIKAWVESSEMADFARKARLRYLKSQIKESLHDFENLRNQYIDAKRNGIPTKNIEKLARGVDKRIKAYQVSISVLEGRITQKNRVTDEMIERAKMYPINHILEMGQNGRARCVFHQGENYNMDIRKNFAYCYVCGESGDTIRVYRAKHGCTFQEAVIQLQ